MKHWPLPSSLLLVWNDVRLWIPGNLTVELIVSHCGRVFKMLMWDTFLWFWWFLFMSSSVLLSSYTLMEMIDWISQAWQMAPARPYPVWTLTSMWPLTPVKTHSWRFYAFKHFRTKFSWPNYAVPNLFVCKVYSMCVKMGLQCDKCGMPFDLRFNVFNHQRQNYSWSN